MEYRKLPHGKENELFSTLGLGMGGIHNCGEDEIEKVIQKAIRQGINFFDLCASSKKVYAPFGRAIAGQRDKVFLQLHFGAVYNSSGDYGWSRNLNQIKNTFQWELETLDTAYTDMGFLHCVDEDNDFDELIAAGVFDYLQEMKSEGKIRYIGFSSHTPSVANRIMDTGLVDIMMFSINPAYDFEKGDEYGIGTVSERAQLFQRCERDGVGISVMKPFHGGQLLNEKSSPFGKSLTRYQCIQYALDRPGVLTVVPGVRSLNDLDQLLGFPEAPSAERDYSAFGGAIGLSAECNCVYCNHCQPCPANIDIGLVNKYYDLSLVGDRMAANHYEKLKIKADACFECGHCNSRCPFHVEQGTRMKKIAKYFTTNNRSIV